MLLLSSLLSLNRYLLTAMTLDQWAKLIDKVIETPACDKLFECVCGRFEQI